MFKKVSITVLVLNQFISGAYAQSCTPDQEGLSAAATIERNMRDFNRTAFGGALAERAQAGSLVYLRSDAISAELGVSHPDFAKSRDFAYAKALVNVQAKFILRKRTQTAAEILTEKYNAEPSSEDLKFIDNDASNEWVRIGDKALRLTEAQLDNALREEGVSEADIQEATRQKRVDLFRSSITRSSSKTAFGAAAGIIPVKSFEAIDCDGRAAVSILAVYSEKNREFIDAILEGHSMKPNAENAEIARFENRVEAEIDNGSIIYEWGIRKLYDTAGLPLLASYGQWGYVPQNGQPKANERKRSSALNQSEAGAIEQLTLFLDSQANFRNETSKEEFANSYIEVTQNSEGTSEVERDISEIIERSSEKFRSRGSVRLTGLSDPIRWDLRYPHDAAQTNVVGSVIYWSPRAEDAINLATGRKADRVVVETPKQTVQNEAQAAGSKVKNNVDDF